MNHAPADPYNDEFAARAPDNWGRMGETEEVEAQLGKAFHEDIQAIREGYGVHYWVGGRPSFTQHDVRVDTETRSLDRVVLHLGVDDDVCPSDAGELNLMICKEDLAASDFEKAICF